MSHAPVVGLNTTIQASDNVVTSQVDDELVMMSVDQGAYYSLDDIGIRIWELLAAPRTVSGICDVLTREYDVAREQCEQDMLAWFNELAEENLIRIIDQPVE